MHTLSSVSAQYNLANLLYTHRESDAVAVSWADRSLSYRQVYAMVGAARFVLVEQGVQPGDRVAVSLPNVPWMPVYYYAALSLGAVCVPLNPLLSAHELQFQLEQSDAVALVSWDGTRVAHSAHELPAELGVSVEELDASYTLPAVSNPKWEPLAVAEESAAVILYTSGTTGNPKGATLTHKNMVSNAVVTSELFGYQEKDVIFGGLPLFHAFGQTVAMNAVFAAGASVAMLPRFTPKGALELIRERGITNMAAVPSMLAAMGAALEKMDVSAYRGTLHSTISGGSALPAPVHEQFRRLLDVPIYEGYGLSETSPVVSFNRPNTGVLIGSVGPVIPGVEVEVRDDNRQPVALGDTGELWVRGDNVMVGYWNNPEATDAVMDGEWFATGDVVRLDDKGNIYIVDRIKDMVLRNGYSIYPRDIEDVIYTHPGVQQCAVVGYPHPKVDEEIQVFIKPVEDMDDTAEAELLREVEDLCREELASYKYPKAYEIIREFPLGPTGKILKTELRKVMVERF
ncbi:AMP-binding protein [Rothia sp. ZJ932]|uniref:AMP-binding protein n=1 Tax=Rothia sp. ZJ932 TaxID=2810516 RepID=UPI0019675018|nr:AMP-binding protein [Rothia sp. ZJ932]QRZ61046.1 AMP-binding protein [Rothia sp. ZJ932]